MSPADDIAATRELDDAPMLPARNRASIALVLVVQTLNSFTDNFIKSLLVVLAIAVASGTELGDKFQVYLGAIFTLPYIVFSPLAGYLSDRYSKQRVIFWMQVAQVLVFLSIAGAVWLRMPQASLLLSLAGFALLATEATFFSPAKMGIMKELAGSRRLGQVSGLLQTTMMAGILIGMWAGGTWYGARLGATGDRWMSCLVPLLAVAGVALLQIIGAGFVQSTPPHPGVVCGREVWWEHFGQLKLLFRDRSIRLAVIGKTYFWFVSNAVMAILVTLSQELHPGDAASAAKTLSLMLLMLGVGVLAGSLLASLLSHKRIELGLVPPAGVGLTLGLLIAGAGPLKEVPVLLALLLTGAAGGCYMVPLYAFAQDRAKPDERARILAGINLMDSFCGLGAMAVVWVFLTFHIPAQWQLLMFVPPSLWAVWFTRKLLPGREKEVRGEK